MMNRSNQPPKSGSESSQGNPLQLAAFAGGLVMHCYRLNMLGAHLIFITTSDSVALKILKPVRLNQPAITASGERAELETTFQRPQDVCYTYVYLDEILTMNTAFAEAIARLERWSDQLESIDADLPAYLCRPPSTQQTCG